MMRLIARLPNKDQVSFLVDSLRNIGFDRKDMIISDLAEEQKWNTPEEAAEEISFIKTERDGLWEMGTFSEGIKGFKGDTGIIVAVKSPKHEADKVRSIMKQSGAVEIIQD
ncbi:MAG: hypothetical protein PWR27_2486 [Petroclostridium sp.]|jgi:hypothetical protein|uniref:hypothetical protein n=1 Tax=Petroclostridium xylanilyticum TaxID=1792311 RepID=UPI001FA8F876|nr:hypothetical protein [Petroclostridium xylanilyticum]MBZ4647560.1 hypothetical protein [Clostridia bacterium]MDK2811777.1 hypothetical protein [Petroclostridium sp.]